MVRKLALIDEHKLKSIEVKSMAENKRLWKGKKGLYNKNEMTKWLKNFDETKLTEIKAKLNKKHAKNVDFDAFNLEMLKNKEY